MVLIWKSINATIYYIPFLLLTGRRRIFIQGNNISRNIFRKINSTIENSENCDIFSGKNNFMSYDYKYFFLMVCLNLLNIFNCIVDFNNFLLSRNNISYSIWVLYSVWKEKNFLYCFILFRERTIELFFFFK